MLGIRKWQKDKKAGFTLIELVAVMVIIGVLAAVAVISYNKSVDAARDSVITEAAEKLKMGVQAYYAANGILPTNTNFYHDIIIEGYVSAQTIGNYQVTFTTAYSDQGVTIAAGSSTTGRQRDYVFTRSSSESDDFTLVASGAFADY